MLSWRIDDEDTLKKLHKRVHCNTVEAVWKKALIYSTLPQGT